MKFLALALALFLVPQDEKITLKFNPQKGDKISKTRKMELQLKINVEAGEQTQELEFEQRGTAKYTVEHVEVADGQVTRKIIDCTEDFEEKKQSPMMPDWTRTDEPMHGRKVTLSLKDGQLVREGADGLKEKDLQKLDLKDREAMLFPSKPVAVGETWEVTGDAVRDFLGTDQEVKDAKFSMKLTAVKEIEKRRCAVITATLDAKVKAENEMDFGVKMEMEVIVWIERGYLLSAKGKGKVTMKGENEQFKLDGEGPITIEQTSKVD